MAKDHIAAGFEQVGRVLSTGGLSLVRQNGPHQERALHADIPAELAQCIADDYSQEDRERLADAAISAALAAIPEQYQGGPIGRNIARAVANMTLGLELLPEATTSMEALNG